jgi:hypothetical protein
MIKTFVGTLTALIMFGVLIVGILVAGTIIGIVLAALWPIAVLFTGVWLIWFLVTDFSKEKPDAK